MSQRSWPERAAEQQSLIDHDMPQYEPQPHSTLSNSQGAGLKPATQRPLQRTRRTHIFIVLITLSTMWLHAILRLAGVAKSADVTLVFNYAAMIVYMVVLHRAGELL